MHPALIRSTLPVAGPTRDLGLMGSVQQSGTSLAWPLFKKNVLFMFCSRSPTKIECLVWEGDGFLLLYKRLQDGRYQWPRTTQEVHEMSQE